MTSKGKVFLVGAGPGDPGLITMRGVEVLGRADVVVYDALVNADFLRFAPRRAEIIYGGKRSKDHAIPQEELNQLLVTKASEGKCVVRLKGGDPYVFGRGGEEAEALASADIPFEVVPGISSTVAGPNYAGIPVTHREHCSSYTVVTGHEDPNRETPAIDWAQIAKTPGTKVILMGVERISQIAEALVANGMSPETPVAMVRWGTTGRQQSIEGSLATIAEVVKKSGFTAPAITIVGDVVKLRSRLNWFEKKTLFGKRIVVTRTRDQASELARELTERGAEVLEIPTIRVMAPTEHQPIAEALLELHAYDWIVFTSPNGVTSFFDFFFKAFEDLRDLGAVRIAAIGPATAARLKELHLKVDLMPEEYVTAKIAGAFAKYESIENLKILLLRAEVANPELPRALEEMGAIVDDIACYKTVPETEDLNGASQRLTEAGADWITFTSSSTVQNFHARFDLPKLIAQFPSLRIASIGPETSKTLAALGVKPAVEARPHTIERLVQGIEEKSKRKD